MSEILWISLGAVAGANVRYGLSLLASHWTSTSLPIGTLIVNVSGSLLIGIMLTLLTERFLLDPHWRLLLVVGFLGSYTTMSSYAFEVIALWERSDAVRAIAYVLGTNVLCLAACYGGVAIVRMMR